jgi:hypothetical protein
MPLAPYSCLEVSYLRSRPMRNYAVIVMLWNYTVIVMLSPPITTRPVVAIVGNQLLVNSQPLLGLQDCLSSIAADGGLGFDGGCRRAAGDCDGPDQIGERFTDLVTYSRAYRAAGFNLFRVGRGGACNPNDPDALVPIMKTLRADGWALWISLYNPDDPLIGTPAGIEYLDTLHSKFAPYVDVWEIASEARPARAWLTEAAARLRNLDAAYGRQIPITTSWNDEDYGPSVDINSPHWYTAFPDIPAAMHGQISAEFFKMTNKPLVFGEIGNSGQNWSRQNVARVSDFVRTARAEGVGVIFWNTSNAKDYQSESANVYLGPDERAAIASIVNAGRPPRSIGQPLPVGRGRHGK